MDHNTIPPFSGKYPWNTNVASRNPRLQYAETVSNVDQPVGISCRHPKLRLVEKYVKAIRHVVRELALPGSIVMHSCLGTGAT